jgi:hypothetical protein
MKFGFVFADEMLHELIPVTGLFGMDVACN